jgi:hypothetical protein
MDTPLRKVLDFDAGAFAQWVDAWIFERNEGLTEEVPVIRGSYYQDPSRSDTTRERIIYV